MSIYDMYKLKTQPSEADLKRQEQNKRMYDIVLGLISEETEEDQKEFAKFYSDLAVYSSFYEQRDTSAYAQYVSEMEAERRSKEQNQGSIAFIEKMIKSAGGPTERATELRNELGLNAPVIGIDYETGNIGFTDPDPSQAQDILAYRRENMLALSAAEQSSIYTTTRLYTAGSNLYRALEEQAPELFKKPTQEEQLYIDRALTFRSSWDRMLDPLPFYNGRTEGRENVDTNVYFLENIRSWMDDSILPTDFLGGSEQEGWDGKKAWEVLKEYHPDFAAYLTTATGLDPDKLINTPNHWEFRYRINEAIDIANLSAVLENYRRDSNWAEYSWDWGVNFLKQSLRSADMPVEIALTALSFGGYGLISAGTIGMRGVKAFRLANTLNDQVQALKNIERLSSATLKTNKIIHGARTTQALMVPSNWGHIVAGTFHNRLMTGAWGLATHGVQWGSEYNLLSRALYMVPIDAGQGLVEGFLYGLQNQLTDGMAWSGERLWQETYSEAFGQIVFGKVFRTLSNIGGTVLEKSNTWAAGPAVWNAFTRKINPDLKKMIELQAQLTNKSLTLDQIQQSYFGAFLILHQHVAWQNMTGNKEGSMPQHVMQSMLVLQNAARQKGVNIDIIALTEEVISNLTVDPKTGETVTFTEPEAALLLLGATIDHMNERGLSFAQTDWDLVNRQVAIQFLVAEEMETMGISRIEQSRMMLEEPAKFKDALQKAYAKVLLEKDKINEKVAKLAEAATSAVSKAGIQGRVRISSDTKDAVNIIDAFRTDTGEFDIGLIKEIFENARSVNLNVSQEVFNQILDFALAKEEAATAEVTPAVEQETVTAPVVSEAPEAPAEAPAEVPAEAPAEAPEAPAEAPEAPAEAPEAPAEAPAEAPEATDVQTSSETESLDPPITESLSEEVVQQPTDLKETLTMEDHQSREDFINELRNDPDPDFNCFRNK